MRMVNIESEIKFYRTSTRQPAVDLHTLSSDDLILVPRYLDVPAGSHITSILVIFSRITTWPFKILWLKLNPFLPSFSFFFSIRVKKFSTLQTFSISQQQDITENKIKKSKWRRIEENFNFMSGPRNQDVRK